MYIDTHCHLNFEKFAGDFDAVINRSFEDEIGALIVPSSNYETSQKAIEIATNHEKVFAAVGLHPIHVKDEPFDSKFEKLIKKKKVVALGETGLDYYYDSSNSELQKEVFRAHRNLALRFSKPLIMHSRNAMDDMFSLLLESSDQIKGVVHCFEGNWEQAKVIFDLGLYISFTGLVTFSRNWETFKVIEKTPLSRLLIETDSPWLAPEPFRGKRNEPIYVKEVAKKIAEIKKISVNEVADQTSKNAIELFALEVDHEN